MADANETDRGQIPQEELPQLPSALSVPGSRALVVGTANYSPGSGLPAVEAAGTTAADVGRVLVERCGLSEAGLRVEVDLATPTDMGVALAEEAERADGVLLFYYVGHGLVSMEGELFLASCVTDGRPAYLRHTALAYASVRSSLLASGAQSVIVVLDCCFSGRALTSLSDSGDESALAAVHGGYVLTAAAREESALAPPGQRHTAFSGELIRLLTEGDEHGEPYIRLRDAYQYLSHILPTRGFPRPRCQAREDTDRLILAPNPAHRPHRSPGQRVRPASTGELEQACPYLGVDVLTAEHAPYFFGREHLTTEVIRQVAADRKHRGPVVLVGATGSGKSSLLGAGLLGALQQRQAPFTGALQWPHIIFRPGVHPVATLARELAMLTGLDADQVVTEIATDPVGVVCRIGQALGYGPRVGPGNCGRLLVVVDQFEETFTDCSDDKERQLFTESLLRLADGAGGQATAANVLLAVRSEYEGHLIVHPELANMLRERRLVVSAMSADEVRSAIEGPAEIAGLTLEPGLADVMLHQLGIGQGDYLQPGRLGVLAHALHTTWRRRVGRMLTISGFEAAGGIPGAAVAVAAEQTYRGLDLAGRQAAQRLLLSLIDVSDQAGPQCRRVPVDQLCAEALAPSVLDAVLKAFADAGAVTVAGGIADMDDLLPQAWPRLADWAEANSAWLPAYDRIFTAAMAWNGTRRSPVSARDPSALLRGSRLAIACNEAANPHMQEHMGPLTREFLNLSLSRERRASRRRSIAIIALAVLLTLTVSLTVIALAQRNSATQQNRLATSGLVAAEADGVRAGDPQLAAQLAVEAYRIQPTAQAVGAVLQSGNSAVITAIKQSPITAAALSPDGGILATAGFDGRVSLWSVIRTGQVTRQETLPVSNGGTPVRAMAFSPDSQTLATVASGRAQVWSLAGRRVPMNIGIPSTQVTAVAVSPSGRTLAVVGSDHAIRLYNMNTLRQIRIPMLSSTMATVAAFSPDDKVLATGDTNGVITLWDTSKSRKIATLRTGDGGVRAVEFSPDGSMLAIGGDNHATQLWSTASPVQLSTLIGDTGVVLGVAFSPYGESLATASLSGATRLWDISSPRHPTMLVVETASSPSTAVTVGPFDMITINANRSVSVLSTSLSQAIAHLCLSVRVPISRSQWNQYLPNLNYDPPCQTFSRGPS